MAITPELLRMAGASEQLIAKVLELAFTEDLAKKREQDRIRQRNHRARNACHSDPCDPRDRGIYTSSYKSLSKKKEESAVTVTSVTSLTVEFTEKFWPIYPRRVARKAALKAFVKARREVSLETILAGVERAIPGWSDPQFIPHAATWLNRGQYADEAPKVNGNARASNVDDFKARWEANTRRQLEERNNENHQTVSDTESSTEGTVDAGALSELKSLTVRALLRGNEKKNGGGNLL